MLFDNKEVVMRLFEFGDLDGVSNLYHIYLREYLVFFYKVFGYYKLWVPSFSNFIKRVGKNKYLECCSGAGEPLTLIDSQLDKNEVGLVNYLLSDIRPNPDVVNKFNQNQLSRFRYIENPVDVTQDLDKFDCPKIFINSFHHFSKKQVEKILINNFKNKNEIVVLEYVSNSLLGYLSMTVGPLVVFLTLPFLVKLRHLPIMALFTYVFPLFPLMMLWDGIVSCLHEHSVEDLKQIVNKLGLDIEISAEKKRSMLYPAGVSFLTITFPE
ncbi:hypothetical protein [Methylomonas rivi]|uniref:Class I SAM-dependent methyltransferase n=1 Tax=Methylomonas rivi TaxID=2952226 RepID=A0ABT1U5N7_9GAMM|nr:hypothetical protein [Methylomonas sp. WSC-6]MCQ8129164.1 hypothetical protein [Methylomonas sp. WSC-6]